MLYKRYNSGFSIFSWPTKPRLIKHNHNSVQRRSLYTILKPNFIGLKSSAYVATIHLRSPRSQRRMCYKLLATYFNICHKSFISTVAKITYNNNAVPYYDRLSST